MAKAASRKKKAGKKPTAKKKLGAKKKAKTATGKKKAVKKPPKKTKAKKKAGKTVAKKAATKKPAKAKKKTVAKKGPAKKAAPAAKAKQAAKKPAPKKPAPKKPVTKKKAVAKPVKKKLSAAEVKAIRAAKAARRRKLKHFRVVLVERHQDLVRAYIRRCRVAAFKHTGSCVALFTLSIGNSISVICTCVTDTALQCFMRSIGYNRSRHKCCVMAMTGRTIVAVFMGRS